jgi:ribonuclease G
MNKDLIISSSEQEVEIALVEDKQLVELHKEKKNHQHVVGDVYLGKVKKIMPGLNAAFVDVANEKDAFLHYLDLGQNYLSVTKYMKQAMNGDPNARTLQNFKVEPTIDKTGKISNVLKGGQYILVQIVKEPISTKGPKLSSDISFAGHYLVLVPFSNRISISQKIKGVEERNRLRRLIQSIRPQNFGIIVRTNAEGRSVVELDSDLRSLIESWKTMTDNLKKATFPQKLVSELNKTSVLLRDVLTDDFNNIYVDNVDMYNEVKGYVKTIAPEKADIVKHYKMNTPIFEQFGIQKQIRSSFGRIVSIRSGVYLIIEHTEALHVIDVNSGNHVKAGEGQEDTALQVNLESAVEIARQLRLRDMGGIIIVDFIDMTQPAHRKQLYDKMVEEMAKDKARHTILPPSKFGLIQITRQRVRPVVAIDVQEKCPLCDGTGTIKSSLTIVDDIEANLKYLLTVQNEQKLTLVTHPYIYAYLTKGIYSKRLKWFLTYKKWVKVKPMESYNLLEYKFLNKEGEEIAM